MKIFYRLENNEFAGFHHLDGKPDDSYFEITQEVFDNLISSGFEVFYSKSLNKLMSIECPSGFIEPKIDTVKNEYFESASLNNQISFWKNRIVQTSKRLNELKDAGLDGDSEYISTQIALEKYRENYMNASHEMALEMDKVF